MNKLSRKFTIFHVFFLACFALYQVQSHAGWRDVLGDLKGSAKDQNLTSAGATLTDTDMVGGLKEALAQGVQSAIQTLGKQDGFLSNDLVKIPIPKSLQTVEKTMRSLGQGHVADSFIESMNHAAEAAVPAAATIFADAVKSMSISDAKSIVQGNDSAATEYFRQRSEGDLRARFAPIVKQATDQVDVTSKYKALTGNLGMMSGLVDTSGLDVDNYVTEKALDGLFKMIAVEEKKIRNNPVARTTDLLKKVFGISP